tara:strand:+ start:1131 stop:1463 length:333 start_codon:yes stop_codon:yes gene_type:complete
MKKRGINTFLILLAISLILAGFNRVVRMLLVTAPLWEFHLVTLKLYLPIKEIEAIKHSIMVWATSRVVLIDTLHNLALLYLAPYVLRFFAKPFAIKESARLHKFLKGDFR